jgi:hypothetical protein
VRPYLTLLLAAAFFAACSGGGTSSTPTPAATGTLAAPSPTATAARPPVPQRPAALKDYALAVAPYLSADPAASKPPCLAALYAAWKMPALDAATACVTGNTDDDPADEVIAAFSQAGDSSAAPVSFSMAIFDRTTNGFRVAYESPAALIAPAAPGALAGLILATGDINANGSGALVYQVPSCGAHTCFKAVHVVRGTASGYVELAPPDGISMEFPDVKVEDTNGDGRKEIVLYGGEIGSVGAGPQRKRTEVWAWDGAAYTLRSTTFDKPAYLYHAIIDADALFAASKYAEAAAAYVAAVDDTQLRLWMSDRNERNELEAYALFRAGLAELAGDGDRDRANALLARANAYAGTLNHQLAGSFEAAFAAKGNISLGCAAVRDDIAPNLAEYTAFWDFGYGNPPFNADAVCPF